MSIKPVLAKAYVPHRSKVNGCRIEVPAITRQLARRCKNRPGHENSITHFIVERHHFQWLSGGIKDLIRRAATQGDPSFAICPGSLFRKSGKDQMPGLLTSGLWYRCPFANSKWFDNRPNLFRVFRLAGEFTQLQLRDQRQRRDVSDLIELVTVNDR